MKTRNKYILLIVLTLVILGFGTADARQNIAQQAYAIFERNCLNCHGEHGAFTEQLIIEHTSLIDTGTVIPGNPDASKFYQRLIETAVEKRMPLGQPPLAPEAIETIRQWIEAGAPDWGATLESDGPFITPQEMLETIEKHVNSLAPFDRAFARYFTLTHLYNAGEATEALYAYQRALSKLVNSLSWGREVIKPQPIDSEKTIFYIDLRDYEWEIGTDRWAQIEQMYPYSIEFNAPTQTGLREKLTGLREEMNCEEPFVHADWFLATASLPPLYHDILGLPATDRELEAELDVDVVSNIRNAAGKRVWRAGFNDSGVSNNNRVVERHISRYGAYWKSYDFAGSVGTQDIFTHPLSFTHDGGEIVFNLPNGLQAYYLADASGNRLDEAPIKIVSNPAASDPTVRNGLSCIGCHTEGMKTFEDQVRAVIEQNPNPPFDKARALRLYTEKAMMHAFIDEDIDRYRQALEAAGDVLGGIEPIQRLYEAFQGPVDAAHAAAVVGLETEAFLQKIRESTGLKNLGLLVLENGTMKRDAWTSKFSEVIFALDFPEKRTSTPVVPQKERIPGESVYIPDANLRAAIAEVLGKVPGDTITAAEMAVLERLELNNKDIGDLTGLEFAINLNWLALNDNNISDFSPIAGLIGLNELRFHNNPVSDLSPLKGLTNLTGMWFEGTQVADLSPLAALINLETLHFATEFVTNLSPLKGLTNLTGLWPHWVRVDDLSPLAGLTNLKTFGMWGNPSAIDLSPFAGLTELEEFDICGADISDLTPVASLTGLKRLSLVSNKISDISPLVGLIELERLDIRKNKISDISPLAGLTELEYLRVSQNEISDFSPLNGIRENIILVWFDNPGFSEGGPKIEGPWLWVALPEADMDSPKDLLSEASGGTVTEMGIATRGAIEGKSVGSSTWTPHKLLPTGWIVDMEDEDNAAIADAFNVPALDESRGIAYGSVSVYSPGGQETTMYVGVSEHRLKVWLNGSLIYYDGYGDASRGSYTDFFPVTLQQGKNVLLIAFHPLDRVFIGFETGTEYTVSNTGIGYNFLQPIHAGDTFTVDFSAENVSDLAGWQFDVAFDPDVLQAIEVSEGDFLKTEGGTTFLQKGVIDNGSGKITRLSSARFGGDGVSGTGTLLSVTFSAKTVGETRLTLQNFQFASASGGIIPVRPYEVVITVEGELATGDVNRDGQVSILDIVLVARYFGETVPANSEVDVNGDGIINILDLILVAQHMGESTTSASPSILAMDSIEGLDTAMIQAWIEQAQLENDGSIAFQHGIANLQRLLASLIPEKTTLLANYPNPFNPETWIPYHLAKPSEIVITIYDTRGSTIRRLDLGHQREGYYTHRSRAAYWDGRNAVGERVASGIYFYQLQVDDLSYLRKMVILK